jgi:hypothetical protein
MRRFGVSLILSALLLLLLPVHASAFWRWLDELSGPGPFNGYDMEVRLLCRMVPARHVNDKDRDGQRYNFPKAEYSTRSFVPIPGVLTHCIFDKDTPADRQRVASFNVGFSHQWTRRTNLDYEVDPARERKITVYSVRPSVWARPARSIEIGAGMGVYWFEGDGFDRFTRVSIEPLLFNVKPVALFRDMLRRGPIDGFPDTQLDQLLSLRVGLVMFPAGFNAEDFGARPGSFNVGADKMSSFSMLIDLEPLVRRIRIKKR